MTYKKLAAAACGLAITAALAACTASAAGTVTPGGASTAPSSTPSGAPAAAPMTVAVTIKDFKFTPAEFSIKKGGTVTWTNQDSVQHDANPLAGGFTKTALLKTGEAGTATFATTGAFDYNCSLHANMKGKVTVVE